MTSNHPLTNTIRADTCVTILLDTARMIEEGIQIFKSGNKKDFLAEGQNGWIKPRFFRMIYDFRNMRMYSPEMLIEDFRLPAPRSSTHTAATGDQRAHSPHGFIDSPRTALLSSPRNRSRAGGHDSTQNPLAAIMVCSSSEERDDQDSDLESHPPGSITREFTSREDCTSAAASDENEPFPTASAQVKALSDGAGSLVQPYDSPSPGPTSDDVDLSENFQSPRYHEGGSSGTPDPRSTPVPKSKALLGAASSSNTAPNRNTIRQKRRKARAARRKREALQQEQALAQPRSNESGTGTESDHGF